MLSECFVLLFLGVSIVSLHATAPPLDLPQSVINKLCALPLRIVAATASFAAECVSLHVVLG